MRDSEFTRILDWPGYRVFRHEIDETNKILRLWARRKRGNRQLICSGCGRIASRSRTGTGQARPRHRSDLHWRCGCRQSASDPFIFRQHLRLPDPLLGANAKMWALDEPHLANIFPRAIPLERSQRPAYSPRYSRVTITHFRHSFAYGCPLSAQPDLEARDVDVFLP